MEDALQIHRFPSNPIISPDLDESLGRSINGPSLIRVPKWTDRPLGRYYLYFAHHQGRFIRMAYADRIAGPWRIHRAGTLRLEQTPCRGHIASPDVHVDHAHRRIVMYYHGDVLGRLRCLVDPLTRRFPFLGGQRSLVATSEDGIHFTSRSGILGSSYFRVFRWSGHHYALAMPGIVYRSLDGLTDFERGPTLFDERMRHAAVRVAGDTLYVFYSAVGDSPERILVSTIELIPDWWRWHASPAETVLVPETDYEGGDLEIEPSARGIVERRARQLRDPCVFDDEERSYLLYSVAGEHGIAIAEIEDLVA